MTLTKRDLVVRISEETGLTQALVFAVVQKTLDSITAALAKGARWDSVFNICEGIKGVAREAQVPALLEAFDIPYVFSDPLTLALALDKAMAKRVVRDAGVPVADFAVIESGDDRQALEIAEWACHDRHLGLQIFPPAEYGAVLAEFGRHPLLGMEGVEPRHFA